MKFNQRFIALLLIGSLACNLFFAGLFLGHLLARGPMGPPSLHDHKFPLTPLLMHVLEELPPKTQEKVLPLLKKHQDLLKKQAQRLKKVRKQSHQLLKAEDFKTELLAESLSVLRKETQTMQETMHAAVLEISAQLSRAERRRLLQALHRPPPPPYGPPHGPPPPFEDDSL